MPDNGPAARCVRCFVAGRVQGVGFRASTRSAALRLGLRGHARNLQDGRVEVLACGASAAVAKFVEWLRHGPPLAEVREIHCEDIKDTVANGFAIL